MATPYRIEMTRAAHRVYKKLDAPIQERVKAEMEKVTAAPNAAPQLSGLPFQIRSHHFSQKGKQWRIAYAVDDAATKVVVARRSRKFL